MRFSQDQTSSVNIVRGYAEGELRINTDVFRVSVIVSATAVREEPDLRGIAELGPDHAAHILEFKPELVLLGTGRRQVYPPPSFGARFLQAGIGFEVMDTGAACRTFNVLVGEQRPVVALLLV